jgi:hypothetical protein
MIVLARTSINLPNFFWRLKIWKCFRQKLQILWSWKFCTQSTNLISEIKLEKLITNWFGHIEGLSIEWFNMLISLYCSLYSNRFANSFLGSKFITKITAYLRFLGISSWKDMKRDCLIDCQFIVCSCCLRGRLSGKNGLSWTVTCDLRCQEPQTQCATPPATTEVNTCRQTQNWNMRKTTLEVDELSVAVSES